MKKYFKVGIFMEHLKQGFMSVIGVVLGLKVVDIVLGKLNKNKPVNNETKTTEA